MGGAGWRCVGEVGSRVGVGVGGMRGACAGVCGACSGLRGACAGRAVEVWVGGVRGACVWGNKCWYRSLRFIIRIPW